MFRLVLHYVRSRRGLRGLLTWLLLREKEGDWLRVRFSDVDWIALEGVEFGLERLHVGAHEVEVEILGGLEMCRDGVEVDFECERELNAALERVEELRVATRELRERAARLSGGI